MTVATTDIGRTKDGADGVLHALFRTPEFQRLCRIVESVPVASTARRIADHIVDGVIAELHKRTKREVAG